MLYPLVSLINSSSVFGGNCLVEKTMRTKLCLAAEADSGKENNTLEVSVLYVTLYESLA